MNEQMVNLRAVVVEPCDGGYVTESDDGTMQFHPSANAVLDWIAARDGQAALDGTPTATLIAWMGPTPWEMD